VDPIDPDVLAGRDPSWREAWGRLDSGSRLRVQDALKRGTRLDDATLEPFIYGLIARRRRQRKWRIAQAAITTSIAGYWVVATTLIRASAFGWLWVPLFVMYLVGLPLALRHEARKLDRAEFAQTSPKARGTIPHGR
jgi:hypothetical protein